METQIVLLWETKSTNLLPIREAYEWKRFIRHPPYNRIDALLPIREAYEWKLFQHCFKGPRVNLASNS